MNSRRRCRDTASRAGRVVSPFPIWRREAWSGAHWDGFFPSPRNSILCIRKLCGGKAHFAIQALGWMVGELSVASAYQRHPPCLCRPLQSPFRAPNHWHRLNGIELTLARSLSLSVLRPSCHHHRTMAPMMAPASRPESSLGHLPGLLCPQMYILYDACNACPKADTPEVYGHSELPKHLRKRGGSIGFVGCLILHLPRQSPYMYLTVNHAFRVVHIDGG